MGADDADKSRRSFALTFSLLCTVLAMVYCSQINSSLVPQWLRAGHAAYLELWPEGWQFFAAQPDTGSLEVYRQNPAEGVSLAIAKQGSAANLWGLGWTSAAEFDEATYLANELPASDWTACQGESVSDCVAGRGVTTLENDVSPTFLCGLVYFVRTQPGAVEQNGGNQRLSVVKVDLQCTH